MRYIGLLLMTVALLLKAQDGTGSSGGGDEFDSERLRKQSHHRVLNASLDSIETEAVRSFLEKYRKQIATDIEKSPHDVRPKGTPQKATCAHTKSEPQAVITLSIQKCEETLKKIEKRVQNPARAARLYENYLIAVLINESIKHIYASVTGNGSTLPARTHLQLENFAILAGDEIANAGKEGKFRVLLNPRNLSYSKLTQFISAHTPSPWEMDETIKDNSIALMSGRCFFSTGKWYGIASNGLMVIHKNKKGELRGFIEGRMQPDGTLEPGNFYDQVVLSPDYKLDKHPIYKTLKHGEVIEKSLVTDSTKYHIRYELTRYGDRYVGIERYTRTIGRVTKGEIRQICSFHNPRTIGNDFTYQDTFFTLGESVYATEQRTLNESVLLNGNAKHAYFGSCFEQKKGESIEFNGILTVSSKDGKLLVGQGHDRNKPVNYFGKVKITEEEFDTHPYYAHRIPATQFKKGLWVPDKEKGYALFLKYYFHKNTHHIMVRRSAYEEGALGMTESMCLYRPSSFPKPPASKLETITLSGEPWAPVQRDRYGLFCPCPRDLFSLYSLINL